MQKLDVIIPGMIIAVVIFSGVFFLMEWQEEQVQWNLLSEEDQE